MNPLHRLGPPGVGAVRFGLPRGVAVRETYPDDLLFPEQYVYPQTWGRKIFIPPMRTQPVPMEGSLRYTFQVSQTVWKKSGVWQSMECPSEDVLEAADVVLTRGGPVEVSDTYAAELQAAGIGTITN